MTISPTHHAFHLPAHGVPGRGRVHLSPELGLADDDRLHRLAAVGDERAAGDRLQPNARVAEMRSIGRNFLVWTRPAGFITNRECRQSICSAKGWRTASNRAAVLISAIRWSRIRTSEIVSKNSATSRLRARTHEVLQLPSQHLHGSSGTLGAAGISSPFGHKVEGGSQH